MAISEKYINDSLRNIEEITNRVYHQALYKKMKMYGDTILQQVLVRRPPNSKIYQTAKMILEQREELKGRVDTD